MNLFHVKTYCYLTSKESISPLEMASCHEIFKQKTGKVLIFNNPIKHTLCCVLGFFSCCSRCLQELDFLIHVSLSPVSLL